MTTRIIGSEGNKVRFKKARIIAHEIQFALRRNSKNMSLNFKDELRTIFEEQNNNPSVRFDIFSWHYLLIFRNLSKLEKMSIKY